MPATWSQTVTVSAATSTPSTLPWIPLDMFETPINVGFGITKAGTGDVTFSVQHTLSNIFDPKVTPNVFTHADVTAATVSIDGNYAYGIRAVRLGPGVFFGGLDPGLRGRAGGERIMSLGTAGVSERIASQGIGSLSLKDQLDLVKDQDRIRTVLGELEEMVSKVVAERQTTSKIVFEAKEEAKGIRAEARKKATQTVKRAEERMAVREEKTGREFAEKREELTARQAEVEALKSSAEQEDTGLKAERRQLQRELREAQKAKTAANLAEQKARAVVEDAETKLRRIDAIWNGQDA